MATSSRRSILRTFASVTVAAVGTRFLTGCESSSTPSTATSEVVLYTSVDQPIAVKVVSAFEAANRGAKVRLVTDTEATKSVGLAAKLRAEKANPICHVWWGNEPFHTIGLASEGMFEPMTGLAGLSEIESTYRDAQDRWAGNGLRARVLAVAQNCPLVKGSLDDLADPQFKGKVGLARPLAGTTGGHVSALFALWGKDKAIAYFRALKANGAILLGGNSEVAQQVGNGNLTIGLTDNDDVYAAGRAGGDLWQVIPDQTGDDIGTLTIPTTVAIVRRDDSPALARQLASFLLSDAAEEVLLDERFVAWSVRPSPDRVRPMNVKYDDVARWMGLAPKQVADIFDERA